LNRQQLNGPIFSALRGPDPRTGVGGVGFAFTPGFRTVRWGKQLFELTDKQALAIEAMHESWFNGLRLHQTEIQGAADTPQRMTELFRGHPAYGTLILHDDSGRYWLDL